MRGLGVWASDSYRPCWLFYPEFCIAASMRWKGRLRVWNAGQSWNAARFGDCRGIFVENLSRYGVCTNLVAAWIYIYIYI